ncbi:MAG: hypothetical protein JSV45_13915 [Chromatiales bacterium]|nr:MAG: hypothetical protein JSV45_13915 [Chromatiales bacterium]
MASRATLPAAAEQMTGIDGGRLEIVVFTFGGFVSVGSCLLRGGRAG